jgi:hypothetical protein
LTISDPDHLPPAQGLPQPRPLRTTSVVIYATLVLLALTIPRGLVNWAKNFEPGAPQQAVLEVAEAIAAASHRIGADRAFDAARELFLRVTGKRED